VRSCRRVRRTRGYRRDQRRGTGAADLRRRARQPARLTDGPGRSRRRLVVSPHVPPESDFAKDVVLTNPAQGFPYAVETRFYHERVAFPEDTAGAFTVGQLDLALQDETVLHRRGVHLHFAECFGLPDAAADPAARKGVLAPGRRDARQQQLRWRFTGFLPV